MRRAANPAITPQMYKHFATLTVVFTAMVAIFANGENDEAAAAPAGEVQAVAHQAPSKPRRVIADQPTSAAAADDAGAWGSDDADGFGAPTMAAPSSGSGWFLGGGGADDDEDDAAAMPGPTAGLDAPTPEQIAEAEAASRMRSGSAETD